ncbi:hypothetical protein BC829DRAFT_225034 [Chytridium lagenaria]|nr:hypothetical protein BC829DRAFT_225034 [Chytridium lagenaria]
MALRALIVAVMILGVVASTTVDRTVLLQDLVGNVTLERCEFLQNLSVGWEDVKNFTGSKRTILIEQNSWDSSRLSSHVFQILLTDVMGYNVEVKEFGGGVTTGRRLANTGIVDMAVELWPSDATEWYTMLVRSNRTVVDHGNIGYTGRVGLYIPAYLVDRYPDLYLDFWRFLRNPRATSIFPRSGTAPFAKDSTGSAVCDGVEAGCMNNTYAPSWYTPSSRSSFIEMLHVVRDIANMCMKG